MLEEFPSAEEIIKARDDAFSNAEQVINDACEEFGTKNNVEVKLKKRSIKKVNAKPFLEKYNNVTDFTSEKVEVYVQNWGDRIGTKINMTIDSAKNPIANLEEIFKRHISTSGKCELSFGYGLDFDVDGGVIRIYQSSGSGKGELDINISQELLEKGKLELIKDIFGIYGLSHAQECIDYATKKWKEYTEMKKSQEEHISEVKEIIDKHNINLPQECIPDIRDKIVDKESIGIGRCMNLEYKLSAINDSSPREIRYNIRLAGKDFIQDDTLSGSLKLAEVAEKLGTPRGFRYNVSCLYIKQAAGSKEVKINVSSVSDVELKSVFGGKKCV